MIFKWIYMYIVGTVDIIVEGFFIERFINICKVQNIILWSSKIEKGTVLRARISKADFKQIRHIARKTSCRVKLEVKNGLPFIMKKYKKRKALGACLLIIAIACFVVTRFIWNIEISGLKNISREEILSDLAKYGIQTGKVKSNLDLDKIKNDIRLNRNDLAWIGIDIKGTNAIVNVVEAIEEPEIIDENTPCNIIADKAGTISKIIVRSGTAKVNIGDTVNQGDILVEGIMEGKYTGVRNVHSDADIYSVSVHEKVKKEAFIQEIEERTGESEKNVEIYINNFKIFFNKGVPKFEKCDTIRAYKKIKLFSNYYIPLEIVNITNFELKKYFKTFTEEELTQKLTDDLKEELNQELGINDLSQVDIKVESAADSDGVIVKVVYLVEEKIGTKE